MTSPHWTLVAQGSRSFLAFLGFVLLCTPPPQPTPPTPAPALLPSLKKALSVGCWPMKGLTDKSIIAATQVPTRSGLGVKHSFACAEPLRTQPHPSSVGSVGPAWEFYCLLGRPCPSWPPHVHCAATAASQCSSHGGWFHLPACQSGQLHSASGQLLTPCSAVQTAGLFSDLVWDVGTSETLSSRP